MSLISNEKLMKQQEHILLEELLKTYS